MFAHLMKYLNDEHYLFKGWIYGIFVMGLLYSVTSIFQVPQLTHMHTYTVISNAVTSSVFGLILAKSLKHLIRSRGADPR